MKNPDLSKALKALWPQGIPLINAPSTLKVNIIKGSKVNLKPVKMPVNHTQGKMVAFRKKLH